ncbi:telomerase inhibitor [Ceratocystis pirilliformis]|uniref:PinX1-related protein 1 n=1 Tax=Ceratocystis pirilliformis TaxID=259994 RepID=A0ABR3YU22_9PEZI
MSVIRPRRTKIGRDPNNTAWARDEASFGQRFMRQQGWQPGDVLGDPTSGHVGMHSQASTSHIRVSLKDDSNGLGWKPGGPDGDDALTGMDVLKDIFGRLNGKGGEEGRREQDRKKGLMYLGRRGGGIAFVRGGLLTGDKMESYEDNDGSESDKSAKTDAGVLQSQLKRKRDANSESSDSDNESESGSDSSTNSKDERQARKRLKAENKEKKAAKKQRKAARKAAKAGRSASIPVSTPTAPSASDSGTESHSQLDLCLGSGSDAPGSARETITHTSKTSDSTAGSDKAARKEKKRLKKEKKAKKEAKRLDKEKKKQKGAKKVKKDSTKDAERQQRVVVRSRLSTHRKAPLDSDAMKRLFMVG